MSLKKIVFICILSCSSLFAQTQEADSLLSLLDTPLSNEERASISLKLSSNYEKSNLTKSRFFAKKALISRYDSVKSIAYNQIGRTYFYSNQLDSAEHHFLNAINSQDKSNSNKIATIKISLGAVQLRKGSYKLAVQTLTESAIFFETLNDSINMAKCYSNISSAFGELGSYSKAILYGQKALDIFEAKKMVRYEIVTLPNLANQLLKVGDTVTAKKYYSQAEQLALNLNDYFSLARIYNNIGNIYLETDYAIAEHYLTKSLSLREKSKISDGLGTLYNNLGYLQLKKKSYSQALFYLKKALNNTQGLTKVATLNNLAEVYKNLKDYESALAYTQEKYVLNDSILNSKNQKSIAEISTKYESAKKEKEILNLQTENLQVNLKRKRNQNLLFATLSGFAGTLIVGFFLFKNARKKQIITKQQHELEHQKVEQLIKDQELIGLDAMIEGQEKERLRVAEELHDNLGGKLSTLKLYLLNLKDIDPKINLKIKTLLNESYEEVRNIAHEKSSKSIVHKGLISAVNLVANRINNSKQLNVEVINIDLQQKIKGYVEIQLFRIIQELISNTIKHAFAKNIIIQFSEDDHVLNLLFEDDGVGFDPLKIQSGLGFENIKSRLRKINGSINIDSSPENGTVVIINVAL